MVDNYYGAPCPAVMSDGRIFRDWRTATRREEYVKYINNIVRDDTQRLFYQANANKIMDGEWDFYKKNQNCWVNDCIFNSPSIRVHPSVFVEQRRANDKLLQPVPARGRYMPCSKQDDFRANDTSK